MSPQLVEQYGHLGVDFVIIGTEVESLDRGRMEDLLRAADATRTLPIVKIRRPSVDLIGEVMNAGATMIMVPHVTNRAQLDNLVRASRFAPEGLRGECPLARYNGFGTKFLGDIHAYSKQIRSIIPIIEDAETLDHLDELMSCPDVDIFEIGPFDLSASLGEPWMIYDSPKCMAAIERITETAQKYGKAVLAPLVFSFKRGSISDILQWQMDELIARGITMLYVGETSLLVECIVNLSVLRKVRVVDEEEQPREKASAGG
jgi:4-hydroxy-2-oxoheptanedioate aldolase